MLGSKCLLRSIFTPPCPTFLLRFIHHSGRRNVGELHSFRLISVNALSVNRSCTIGPWNHCLTREYARVRTNESIEMKTDEDVIRFKIGDMSPEGMSLKKGKATTKKSDVSRKKKLNELRFYRLKAKKKMNSPNPEVRIRYKLEKVDKISYIAVAGFLDYFS